MKFAAPDYNLAHRTLQELLKSSKVDWCYQSQGSTDQQASTENPLSASSSNAILAQSPASSSANWNSNTVPSLHLNDAIGLLTMSVVFPFSNGSAAKLPISFLSVLLWRW
jgi:hypothetical protein